jgi:hypothetical protein
MNPTPVLPENAMALLSVSPLRRWPTIAAILLLCVASVGAAQAQSTGDGGDPPDRVARLSYLDGDVGLLPAGAHDWGDASINRPLTTGDKLSSGGDARAELELDGGTLRIDRDTDFGFLELSDQLAQVELTQGTLNLAVRRLDEGQSYEIDTPTVALVVDQPGTFRVDIAADGHATRVTAWDGSATVYGENGAQRRIVAGRSYRFQDPALDDVELVDIAGGDAFDDWCGDRDRRYASSETRRYVSEDVVGYQDLDRYGDWRDDPQYGQVWYPSRVDADWAPYREGHWAYIAPWGWSWVDDAPWGFAPYHYGRWANVRGAWGWVPGPIAIRPVYAPALVAFVGGGGWSVSVGSGAPVGWFPLGPGEIYDPWYHGSQRYYTQINVTNIYVSGRHHHEVMDRIHHHYDRYRHGLPVRGERYAHRDGRGFTAVPARSFADSRQVGRHRLRVDPRRLASAPILGRKATPRPTAQSFAPPRSGRRPLPAHGFDRTVVARHEPPARLAGPRLAVAGDRTRVSHRRDAPAPTPVRVLSPRRQDAPSAMVSRRLPEPAARRRAVRPDAGSPPDGLRPGELRSARFVRTRAERATRTSPQPIVRPAAADAARESRPGVSYITPADRPREARPIPSQRAELPRVPRFVRAPPPASGSDRTPRVETVRAPRPSPREERPQQRFNPQQVAQPRFARAPDSEAPRHAAPSRRIERAPQGYAPRHADAPARPMPQSRPPRAAAAAAPQSDQRPRPRAQQPPRTRHGPPKAQQQ